MIERYSRPEMANIWTEENKYRAWLEVEILADEAWAELGEIPKEDVALIREKADFDIDRILGNRAANTSRCGGLHTCGF